MTLPGDRLVSIAGAAIITLGAALRLGGIDRGVFLLDQAGYYTIAQNAVANRALPVAGVSSSIGTLTQPAAILLYSPFALLRDPVFGMYATALANVVALWLTFRLAWRYFGPATAIVSTLLFAVSAQSVHFSRFIWQQNLLPPVVLTLFWLVLTGAQGGRRGWLAWALPVWGVAVQLHPAMVPLVALLVISWAMAPPTVRGRDLAIGIVALITVFVPTIVWEVATDYRDTRVLLAYTARPAATDLDVLRNLISILGLPSRVAAGSTVIGLLAAAISVIVPLIGMLYLACRVSARALHGLRRSWLGFPGWARASAQAQWRGELLLIGWPLVIVLSQIRHHSPVFIFYLIGVLPAAYLAVGVFVERMLAAGRAARSTGSPWPRQLAWRISTGLVGVTLISACWAQLYAAPAAVGDPDAALSLRAEKAGLATSTALVRARGVALAVIQTSYFTMDSVIYLLKNGFDLGVPIHVASTRAPGDLPACLAAPVGGQFLYLVAHLGIAGGSPVEAYLTHRLGAVDILASTTGGGFFRGYVISAADIERDAARLGLGGNRRLRIEFGEEMVLQRIWKAPLPDGPGWLVLGFALTNPMAGRDHAHFYRIVAETTGGSDEARRQDMIDCYGSPWVRGQQLLVFLPDLDGRIGGRSTRIRVEAGRAAPYPSRLGWLRLESVFGAPSGHYLRPSETVALSPGPCEGEQTKCRDGHAWIRFESEEGDNQQPVHGGR